MTVKAIDTEKLRAADYSTLVGIVRERNRPSGGIRTLHAFARGSFLSPEKKVLEVGCNTGFSVVNLSLLTGAECHGVDINPQSVEEARSYAETSGASSRTTFKVGSALEIPYPDAHFDALWVSNVTSFISDKIGAFSEYLRVLKPNGFLGVAPIYYQESPPADVFAEVETLIGAKITVRDLAAWRATIQEAAHTAQVKIVECASCDYKYLDQTNRIDGWLESILSKPHLKVFELEAKRILAERYSHCMKIFNENLKYCGFSLLIYQKRLAEEEEELFLTQGA